MRWSIRVMLLCAVAISLTGGLAAADHMACNGDIIEIGVDPAVVYVDDRGGEEIWVYLESNGVAGLQSGGVNLLGFVDLCGHEDPDTVIF